MYFNLQWSKERSKVKGKSADKKLFKCEICDFRRIKQPDVVFHAKRPARVFQSMVHVLPRSYAIAVKNDDVYEKVDAADEIEAAL